MFNAIADAMPAISKAGDPQRLRSGWLNGIKRLPVSLPLSSAHLADTFGLPTALEVRSTGAATSTETLGGR